MFRIFILSYSRGQRSVSPVQPEGRALDLAPRHERAPVGAGAGPRGRRRHEGVLRPLLLAARARAVHADLAGRAEVLGNPRCYKSIR